MPNVVVPETGLSVLDQGTGQPLLLVHGFPLDHSMWQGQIDDLSRDYRVLAPDLCGFGRSHVQAGTVSMEQFAADLAGTLDALQVREPITFCGLSMGGYIGWQFFQRYRPRLAALILCDTRAVADSAEAARGRLATAERVLSEGVAMLADTMLPRLFSPGTSSQRPDLVERTRRVILATPAPGAAAALRGMAQRPDFTSRLETIDVPTLVLCGQHDAISSVEEMRGIASRIPKSRFVEIPDAGHMAPLEKPPAVNAAIRSFLPQG